MKRERKTIRLSELNREKADIDILDVEHAVGLSLDADEEHPKPLNILRDIEKAEAYKRTH